MLNEPSVTDYRSTENRNPINGLLETGLFCHASGRIETEDRGGNISIVGLKVWTKKRQSERI